MNELKPCPFCGGKAKLQKSYNQYFLVQCVDCCNCTPLRRYENQAINAWNRRVEKESYILNVKGE